MSGGEGGGAALADGVGGSLADEPAVKDSQFDWPLKLKLWFRASSAWAVSVSSLMTAWRRATRPVIDAEHQDGEDEQDLARHQGATAVVVPQVPKHGRSPQGVKWLPVGHTSREAIHCASGVPVRGGIGAVRGILTEGGNCQEQGLDRERRTHPQP